MFSVDVWNHSLERKFNSLSH